MWKKLLLLYLMLWTVPVHAAGMFTHYLMAKKALDLVRNPRLKYMLRQHYKEYQNGVIFPDTGYLMHNYGESAHWDTMLTPYIEYIKEKCSATFDHNYHCQQMLAHFFGAVTHSISDVNWDHHFLQTASNMCPHLGNTNEAGNFTDRLLDQIVLYENRFQYASLRRWAPADDLSLIYQRFGRNLPPKAFKQATGWFFFFRNVLRAFSSILMHSTRGICSWASNNYMNARGGVNDTAREVAKVLDEMWEIIEPAPMFQRVPIIKFAGGWPGGTYSIHPKL